MRLDPGTGAVNPSQIVGLCSDAAGVDGHLLEELLRLFVDDNFARLAGAAEALPARDRTALREAAHTIRGAAATMGADGLRDAALTLECAAPEAAWPDLADQLAALHAEFRAVVRTLAALYPEFVGVDRIQ